MTRHATGHPRTTFAANLRAARADSGLTQKELAALVGVDAITISRWERGTSRPEDTRLMALCEHLGREVGWFYTEAAA